MMAAGGGSPLEAPAAGTAYRQRPASRWHWMPLRMPRGRLVRAVTCTIDGRVPRRTPRPTHHTRRQSVAGGRRRQPINVMAMTRTAPSRKITRWQNSAE